MVYDILEYTHFVSKKNLRLNLVYYFLNIRFNRIFRYKSKFLKFKFLEVNFKKYNFQNIQNKKRYQNLIYLRLSCVNYLNILVPNMCKYLFIDNCYYVEVYGDMNCKQLSITNSYITNLEFIDFNTECLELINIKPFTREMIVHKNVKKIIIDDDYFKELPEHIHELKMYYTSLYKPKSVNILTTISENIPYVLERIKDNKIYYLKIYGRLKIKNFDFSNFINLQIFINCSGYNLGNSINYLKLPPNLKKLSMRLMVDRNKTSIVFPKIMKINKDSMFDKNYLKIIYDDNFTYIKPIFDCLYYLRFELLFD